MHSPDSRAANLLGAASLAVAGAVRDSVEGAAGMGGAVPAALVSIDAYPGRPIDRLRQALRLSQPGAVRLVDRLEAEGWVTRARAGRAVALVLTPAGQRVVERLLAARERALAAALAPLSEDERAQLVPLLEKLLAAGTHDRGDLEHICRLCERAVCERCPVDEALYGGDPD
jgi:DNA-binding MarR family transcriptional regulator